MQSQSTVESEEGNTNMNHLLAKALAGCGSLTDKETIYRVKSLADELCNKINVAAIQAEMKLPTPSLQVSLKEPMTERGASRARHELQEISEESPSEKGTPT